MLQTYGRSIRNVASARKKHGVAPPSTDGPDEFQRVMRAQQNTLEYLPLIIPLIWMSAVLLPVVGGLAALVGGGAWSFFRVQFIEGYAEAADKRHAGFHGSLMATYVLMAVAVVGCLYQLALAFD